MSTHTVSPCFWYIALASGKQKFRDFQSNKLYVKLSSQCPSIPLSSMIFLISFCTYSLVMSSGVQWYTVWNSTSFCFTPAGWSFIFYSCVLFLWEEKEWGVIIHSSILFILISIFMWMCIMINVNQAFPFFTNWRILMYSVSPFVEAASLSESVSFVQLQFYCNCTVYYMV